MPASARIAAFLKEPLVAFGVLLAALAVAIGAWLSAGALVDADERADFVREAEETGHHVQSWAQRHIDLVAALQTHFHSAQFIDRVGFHRYVAGLDLRHNYPAVLALQYAPLIGERERSAFEQAVRNDRSLERDGYPTYAVHPAGPRTDYLPVLFNEPLTGNEAALGHDQIFDPERRAVSMLARDTGEVKASAPLSLVQDRQGVPALAIRAAVYRSEAPLQTIADRRAAHVGQITGIFRGADLVRASVSDDFLQRTRLTIDDVGSGSLVRPVHSSPRPLFASTDASRSRPRWLAAPIMIEHVQRFEVGGRLWEARFERPHSPGWARSGPLAILVAGASASALLFFLLRSLATQRAAAVRLAERMTERVREREREYRTLMEQLHEVVIRLDLDGRITFLNPAWERATGYACADSLNRSLREFVDPSDHDDFDRALAALVNDGAADGSWTARIVTKSGDRRWLEARVRLAVADDGSAQAIAGTLFDVSDRVAAEREFERRAQHDPLTGLPNRLLLGERFAIAAAHLRETGGQLALLYVDLDRFKAVNDTHGHDVGDGLLRAVAARLRACVRPTDTVARVGGDEFVVLLPGARHPEVSERIAASIRDALAAEVFVDGHRLSITPSVGLAAYPEDGATLATLMACADTAMYRAKKRGRDRVEVYSPEADAA